MAALWLVVVTCLAAAAAPPEQVLRAPSMPEWKLLYKVAPEYPPLALQLHIHGVVRFSAVIGKDGHVERLPLLGGHPLLVQAARQAARQWIYRPTYLDGKPVRVVTTIEVPFLLDRTTHSGGPVATRTPDLYRVKVCWRLVA